MIHRIDIIHRIGMIDSWVWHAIYDIHIITKKLCHQLVFTDYQPMAELL